MGSGVPSNDGHRCRLFACAPGLLRDPSARCHLLLRAPCHLRDRAPCHLRDRAPCHLHPTALPLPSCLLLLRVPLPTPHPPPPRRLRRLRTRRRSPRPILLLLHLRDRAPCHLRDRAPCHLPFPAHGARSRSAFTSPGGDPVRPSTLRDVHAPWRRPRPAKPCEKSKHTPWRRAREAELDFRTPDDMSPISQPHLHSHKSYAALYTYTCMCLIQFLIPQ